MQHTWAPGRRHAMYVPGRLERVRIAGLGEVYLVTHVSEAKQSADLLPIVYGQRLVRCCPFMFLEAIQGCGPPCSEPDEQPVPDGAVTPLAMIGKRVW